MPATSIVSIVSTSSLSLRFPWAVRNGNISSELGALTLIEALALSRIIYWIWALNRNPEYWGSDAATFNPYRWISRDESNKQYPNKHGGAPSNYSYMSFLHGPRGCVGKDTSKATLRAAIARLVLDFEISRDPNGPLELEPKGATIVRPSKDLKLKFSPIGATRP